MLSLTWKEPLIGIGWSIYDTECLTYRIDHENGVYSPRRAVTRKTEYGVERFYEYIGRDVSTLDEATDVINQYHCNVHNLILV